MSRKIYETYIPNFLHAIRIIVNDETNEMTVYGIKEDPFGTLYYSKYYSLDNHKEDMSWLICELIFRNTGLNEIIEDGDVDPLCEKAETEA